MENVDLNSVKDEVSKFQTMIWPEETFQGSRRIMLRIIMLMNNQIMTGWKGDWFMGLLYSHWHCILPAAALIAGLFFMRRNENKSE